MRTFIDVVYYELKTSFRSILSLVLAFVLATLLLDYSNVSNGNWDSRGVSSIIPFVFVLCMNFFFTFFAAMKAVNVHAVIAGSNTTDALFVRSFGNMTYILAIFIGQLIYFLSFAIIVLSALFLYNLLVLDDAGVSYMSYLAYPFLFMLPALVFILGLSFFAAFFVKNKGLSVVFLILVFMALLTSADYSNGLFDYLGVYVPSLYSDFIGFGNFRDILLQRVPIFLMGVMGLSAVPFLFPRLSQTAGERILASAAVLLCIGGIAVCHHLFIKDAPEAVKLRAEIRALNDRCYRLPRPRMTACDLTVEHRGKSIAAAAEVTLKNTTGAPVDTCLFSLNPGLEILSVSDGGGKIAFDRKRHLVFVPKTLAPEEEAHLTIRYEGSIDENACYADIDEREHALLNNHKSYIVDKRCAFIEPGYVLLTEEAMWYPVSGVPRGSVMPKEYHSDFVRFSLAVKADSSLTVISQGAPGTGPDGVRTFACEHPLTQLSLVIGDYERKSLVVDNVEYNLYLKRGHDFLTDYFAEIENSIPKLITREKQDLEFKLGLSYPFNRFSVIETPVQFLAYERYWSISPATIQPEQVLVPEKGIFQHTFDLATQNMYAESYPVPLVKTPENIKQHVFTRMISEFKQTDYMEKTRMKALHQKPYSFHNKTFFFYDCSALSNYGPFVMSFDVPEHPFFQHMFPFYLVWKYDPYTVYHAGNIMIRKPTSTEYIVPESAVETAEKAIEKQSLMELCESPVKNDTKEAAFRCMSVNLMQYFKAITGNRPVTSFMNTFLESSRFSTVTGEEFNTAFRESFGVDPEPVIAVWGEEKGLPAFSVTDVRREKCKGPRRIKYYYTFVVANTGEGGGVIEVSFPNYKAYRGDKNDVETTGRCYYLAPRETKKIGLVLNYESNLYINASMSRNKPSLFTVRPDERSVSSDSHFIEGETVLDEYNEETDPDIIIVDNTDPGFEVDNGRREGVLVKAFRKNDPPERPAPEVVHSAYRSPEWRHIIDGRFYGKLVHSAYMVISGTGEKTARWNTDIKEDGSYEVFMYNAFDRREVKTYHFRVYHVDGVSDVMPEVKMFDRWVSLGTYHFSKGAAAIEMTDETNVHTNDNFVIADAVKWVRIRK